MVRNRSMYQLEWSGFSATSAIHDFGSIGGILAERPPQREGGSAAVRFPPSVDGEQLCGSAGGLALHAVSEADGGGELRERGA
jgi:hypothetical protein